MYSRYLNMDSVNKSEIYDGVFREKGVRFIKQYKTPASQTEIDLLTLKDVVYYRHIWTNGDRYYKLAEKYLGDPLDWWIIARINKKPTEAHINLGDVILIPKNVEEILRYIR